MPSSNWEIDKKKAAEFEKGFNSRGPSLSDAWSNVMRGLGLSGQPQAQPTEPPKPIVAQKPVAMPDSNPDAGAFANLYRALGLGSKAQTLDDENRDKDKEEDDER